jgi:azurin
MTLGLVRVLGWLVIAHGLSHAVLPMRGSLAPTLSHGDWMPAVLYSVSMLGFLAAGLGLLGLRPLDRAISPLLVLASGWSLVALVRFGDASLAFGAVCDVALLVVGVWGAARGWPQHPSHGRLWHVVGLALGYSLLTYVGAAAFTYPAHRTWGSTREELTMSLPSDPEGRNPARDVQHAITIDAPPEDVWVWLVQMGQDRAGFYSYDWVERALGLDIRNVLEVRPEWQTLGPGDVVRGTQPSYLGGLFGNHGWKVVEVVPYRVLVLENWGTFLLEPIGEDRTRFIIRSPATNRNVAPWSSAVRLAFQLPHFLMQRRMMVTIKALAEARYAARNAEDPARLVEITATDDMKYSLTTIVAEPGERLRIQLRSLGVIPKVAMAHNVVVLEIDTDIDTLLKDGAPYRDTDFIPPSMSDKVIAKTALAGPGETVGVTFVVPEIPGEYPFICTFAGHYQAGMRGTLVVTDAASGADRSASGGD